MRFSTFAGGATFDAPGLGGFVGSEKRTMVAPPSGDRPIEVSRGWPMTGTLSTLVPFAPRNTIFPNEELNENPSSVALLAEAELPRALSRKNPLARMKLSVGKMCREG